MNETTQKIDAGVYREGINFFFDPKITIPEGTKRGINLICETAKHRKRRIDEALLKKLQGEAVYYLPGVRGEYRESGEAIMVGPEEQNGVMIRQHFSLAKGPELKWRMYLFGKWLEGKTEDLKEQPNNLPLALDVACEASYGLISPDLHPFHDGNGRTSRLLANLILMVNAHEIMYYGVNILPVPQMRKVTSKKSPEANNPDPYLLVLNRVHRTKDLNPYIRYVADLWMRNLQRMTNDFDKVIKEKCHGKMYEGDSGLIAKFQERIMTLKGILERLNSKNNQEPHLVPNYFKSNLY